MKIAVTGGEGYLGTHVARFFNAKSLSRRTGLDVTDRKQCRQLRDYDVIIHMAALIDRSEERREKAFEVNATGTLNVAKALRENQVLIFTSTKDVYDSKDPYSLSKAAGERRIDFIQRHKGLRVGIFRLSTTYARPVNGSGFVNLFVKSVKEGLELSLLMEGKQRRDFLYVDDLSRAFERFINSKAICETYDIGGGKENSTTIIGLVRVIERITSKKAKISFSDKKAWGQTHYVTDLRQVSKELNWRPEISLEEGIKRLIQ